MELTAVITPAEEGGFTALNPATGTTTQGETIEEAVVNLTEATALYLSEFALPMSGHSFVVHAGDAGTCLSFLMCAAQRFSAPLSRLASSRCAKAEATSS